VIEPEDFKFYEKIKVPPPTFCPECRMERRMMWRNEITFFNRKCDAPKHTENVFSIYRNDMQRVVYDERFWWSDDWNPLEYAKNYDFSRPFFEQFAELLREIPFPPLDNSEPGRITNGKYTNDCWDIKNCYLAVTAGYSEDCYYVYTILNSKNIFDSLWLIKSQNCYECVDCKNCYNLFFSQYAEDCMDSHFLYDCRDCINCFGCVGLRHKKYHIYNKAYSKEDYFKKLLELQQGSHSAFKEILKNFHELLFSYPHRFAYLVNTQNVLGNNVRNSRNCIYCYDTEDNVENSKFLAKTGLGIKDSYDLYNSGTNLQLSYDSAAIGNNLSKVYFSMMAIINYNIYYSTNIHNCNNLFACIGLRNKSYCILNKQYTKEEYEKLVPRIIEHMNQMPYTDKKGRVYKYGEFFPPELSPFAYNETIAQEYFPLTKSEALAKGYSWKDPEPRNYQIQIPNDQLPDHIKDVKDDIVGQVIECAHAVGPDEGRANGSSSETSGQTAGAVCNEQCTEAYKIIPQELAFLKKMNLPLPRLCPNCRHYQRIKQRNPLKLWHRKCQCAGETSENKVYQNTADHIHHSKTEHCQNEFETTYAPERPEIVYCEACYLREVV